ncbi:MAG: glutathione S-transferase family protein, partial [Pseudomonadota bacterium]
MTYTLYNRLGSGGFAVEAALTLTGAPFELIDVGTKPRDVLPESFRTTNPLGQVPVLKTPEGGFMTESGAMLIYLGGAHPEAGLAPTPGSPENAAYLRWIMFMSVNLYENLLRVNYPGRYTAGEDPPGVAKAGMKRTAEAFSVIEGALEQGFLCGDRMNAADIYLAMFSAWFRVDERLPGCERITRAVASDPRLA